jgi:hypothetical protein
MTAILNDTESGFGCVMLITGPDGTAAEFTGFTTDIAFVIDPETGVPVSGRSASVAISLSDVAWRGMELPRGIQDQSKKPWIVEFNDVNGNPFIYKVMTSNPDRTLGMLTLQLEFYRD